MVTMMLVMNLEVNGDKMVIREIINGKIFLAQTTFYVYRNESDLINDKIPCLITSDKKLWNKYKRQKNNTLFFSHQTIFYIYNSEDDLQNNKIPCLITSDKKLWNRYKRQKNNTLLFSHQTIYYIYNSEDDIKLQ